MVIPYRTASLKSQIKPLIIGTPFSAIGRPNLPAQLADTHF
jgi:hypothetical protein